MPLRALLTLLLLPACGLSSNADCGPIKGSIQVQQDRLLPSAARIAPADARVAALVAFPGARITEIDLDEEDGFLVYELSLYHDPLDFDVVVDAGTGRVLCSERD
jgi:uncharacterized membrane protein YkoI